MRVEGPVLIARAFILFGLIFVAVVVIGVRQTLGKPSQLHPFSQHQHGTFGLACQVVFDCSQRRAGNHKQVCLRYLADVGRRDREGVRVGA